MSDTGRQTARPGVLSDHKRIGKRFIPPLVQALGHLHEVKWVDRPLPELLWLALLNHYHGLRRGAQLATEAARAGLAAVNETKRVWFGPMSAFAGLSRPQQESTVVALSGHGGLEHLRLALSGLVALYPECPLAFVFSADAPPKRRTDEAAVLGSLLAGLFDKSSKSAMLMQANAVYIAFATDMLRVSSSTSLASFPAVADYPDTEDSKRVAAAVRATVTGLFAEAYDDASRWPSYFWNRGLEIAPCCFGTDASNA